MLRFQDMQKRSPGAFSFCGGIIFPIIPDDGIAAWKNFFDADKGFSLQSADYVVYCNIKGVKHINSMIYDPLAEYESKFRSLHSEKAEKFFDALREKSGIAVEENRTTVKKYHECNDNLKKQKKKLNLFRFLRVLMIITILLIPLVILKMTPRIRQMRSDIENEDKRAAELLAAANAQMQPLNQLFTDRDAVHLIEETIPLFEFAPDFSVKQEADMIQNYDFDGISDTERSAVDLLAGSYNDNPFVFENQLIHRMGEEVYHGYKTISWTETYRDSDGHTKTRVRTETLHATVTKPKPFYSTQVALNYCAQGAPDLSFSRDATHLEQKSDKEIEKYVKKGEKKLKKKTDKAIRDDGNFTSMSNSDFEVLFDALDRTDEVQFRTLFTPLAQTNMVSLIRSRVGYGDDFHFIKRRRTNRIISSHSQGRSLTLNPADYASFSYDETRENFLAKNAEFFKSVYFDFAPLLAIPVYQERPVYSLKPIPDYSQRYSNMDCEVLLNRMDPHRAVHPDTKTRAILKPEYIGSVNTSDRIRVTAYSYDMEPRVDFVPVLGGDGHIHSVPVPWDEYLPLEATNDFLVSADNEKIPTNSVFAKCNGLCLRGFE